MRAKQSEIFICARQNVLLKREMESLTTICFCRTKTGTLDGKVWDPNSGGIADYDEMDFIEVFGKVISYNGTLQLNIRQIRKAFEDEYNPADYMPTSEKSVDAMYDELLGYIKQVSNIYLRQALEYYFVNDEVLTETIQDTFGGKNSPSRFRRRSVRAYIKYCKTLRILCGSIPDFK